MSETPSWLTDVAESVLRVLYPAGVAVSVGGILVNLDAFTDAEPARDDAEDALDTLVSENVVREVRDGYYILTEHGRDYVEHEIETEGIGFIE